MRDMQEKPKVWQDRWGYWYHATYNSTGFLTGEKIPVKCLAYLLYGSRAYGTADDNSDWDAYKIIDGTGIIVETWGTGSRSEPGRPAEQNEKMCSVDEYQRLLTEHEITAIESYFFGLQEDRLSKIDVTFTVNLSKLREVISSTVSNSWVKAKKKIDVEAPKYPRTDWRNCEEIYRGKKSLFHSLRIARFGIQLAKHGKIMDFGGCNDLFSEIMKNDAETWQPYKDKYQSLKNQYMTEFREMAPKA